MTTWLDSPSIFESTELENTLLAHEFIIQSLESSQSQFLRILPNLSNVYLLLFHLELLCLPLYTEKDLGN